MEAQLFGSLGQVPVAAVDDVGDIIVFKPPQGLLKGKAVVLQERGARRRRITRNGGS